ncbi:---NA--- [Paramuricea clavata]|uniref:---NA n=1 Tax=Paramuricea clavata TaxID=317549 RepID=A0A6S7GWY0_PARCT|nr:---NA--- [Paramuricea clavata]
MADKIQTFLEKNNLSQYVNKFMELGYDDLKQLLDMQPEEIMDVLKEVVLYDKSVISVSENDFYLHSAIEILSSKTKHGVQDKNMASQPTTPMSSVSHKYVTTCKYIYFNIFCLADIKNKENFGKTEGQQQPKICGFLILESQ